MFFHDTPIQTKEEDFLGREKFAQHLGGALLGWKQEKSLVIALCGEWGSGKSSIINLTLQNIKNNEHQSNSAIIQFNPWAFSGDKNLVKHFFDEITRELGKEKKNIAKKFSQYGNLLILSLGEILSPSLISGLLLLASDVLLKISNFFKERCKLVSNILLNFSNFFKEKSELKTLSKIKEELKEEITNSQKKLIIVIDDIDRLNQSEIKQIFQLIKVNADFPNTIYLLAFDRKVVEMNLDEQKGISGKDYMDKIVQVNFDVPSVNHSKILKHLFGQLVNILNKLPEKSTKKPFLKEGDLYREEIFNSGFKDFFRNIRDVKRFINSLEFNISQMHQNDVMEVNPIDFIAIEAIRVFVPDFYLFMKNEKYLFTSTNFNIDLNDDDEIKRKKSQKDDVEEILNKLPKEIKNSVRKLIQELFPHIKIIYDVIAVNHEEPELQRKKLRVCTREHFDCYFTLIPGGGEEGALTQYELEEILDKTNSAEDLETILREYIKQEKIRTILERIPDFIRDYHSIHDHQYIPQKNVINVINALLNIYDDLPKEKFNIFNSRLLHERLMNIIRKLLKQEKDNDKNFEILKEIILSSKNLYCIVGVIVFILTKKEGGIFIVPEDKIEYLQKSCITKIEKFGTNNLLRQKKLKVILFQWKKWDKEEKWNEFIKEIKKDDEKLLEFIDKFTSDDGISNFNYSEEGVKIIFNYTSLSEFFDLDKLKEKLEVIKGRNSDLYETHKEIIDLYLDNFNKKDNYPFNQ